MTEDPI